MNPALSQHRTAIDQLDLELLGLINRRAQAVAEIARLKRESDLPVSWSAAGKHRCRVLTVTPSKSATSPS